MQSVSGLHSGTNPVSGDFSVGAEGLMVRDGAFAEPVREVTIASTLPRMLLDVVEIGSDLTWLPGGAAGMTLLRRRDGRQRFLTTPRRSRIARSSAIVASGSRPTCTVSIPSARAAATLSTLSSRNTDSSGRTPAREHVSS